MKKKVKNIYLLIGILTVCFSCNDSFLEEELVAVNTTEYMNTAQGLNECLNASYNILRWRFNGEHGYALTNYGTDELTVANGDDMMHYNNYSEMLNPDDQNKWGSENFYTIRDLWDFAYGTLKVCNIGLENVKIINDGNFANDEYRLNVKGQLLFLRAFSYFDLVQQFGAVPMVVENVTGIETNFTRTPVEDIYKQIIADLKEAYSILYAVPQESGRITKGAAAHYLAKVYLTRASEVNSNWNSVYSNDLDSAIYFAEQVLPETNSSIYSLEDDFASLFNYSTPNGANEQSAEIILAAQFTNNEAAIGDPSSYHRGNKVHLYVLDWYQDQPGFERDIENGRPWRRLCPNDYALDVFDRKNDSRFYKTFKTTYYTNKVSNLALGDTGIVYLVNSIENPIAQSAIDTMRYAVFARYIDQDGTIVKNMPDETKQHYCPISKYLDPSRLEVAQEEGYRDGILARLAETYLIAAEAYGLKNDYGKAMQYINILRARAAYKDGESRGSLYEMAQGNVGSTTSTVDELLIKNAGELTNLPADPVKAAFFIKTGAASPKDIFIAHILDERSRELMCEMHRWTDLVRTKTLITRATALNGSPDDFNGSAQPIEGKHELRPIPQVFIDGLLKDGVPYSSAEKVNYQNPGY